MRISDWSSDVCSSDLWGWRRGAAEARDFAAAWCLPMAVLAFINIVDVENGFWGGGSKLLVLLAATWQALWLSAAATRPLARLRAERDPARGESRRTEGRVRVCPSVENSGVGVALK